MFVVVLFDLDETLLRTGGAGVLAMNRAFEDLFGIANALDGIPYAGRMDPQILSDALAKHGIRDATGPILSRLKERYLEHLRQTLWEREGHVMPGVPQLLQALLAQPEVAVGLATGNFREAAWLKLQRYGLNSFFAEGAFGEDAPDRAQLVALAAQRVAKDRVPQRTIVVGDTPRDVEAALACGFWAVGVATGRYSQEELKAVGAHLTFPHLGDWERAFNAFLF